MKTFKKLCISILGVLLSIGFASHYAFAAITVSTGTFLDQKGRPEKVCPGTCEMRGLAWDGRWLKQPSTGLGLCECDQPTPIIVMSPQPAPACVANNQVICKTFELLNEYTEFGSCNKKRCALGIPRDALANYEIEIKDGLAYYKSDSTKFTSWSGGNKQTLYVIDARDGGHIYFVNVDGQYIQARGTANCLGSSVPQNASTSTCSIPRATTHAGILMGFMVGLPVDMTKVKPGAEIRIPKYQNITVIGAGTVVVSNGDIQQITNDSSNFKPTQEDFQRTLKFFNTKGVKAFPPSAGCPYEFVPLPGKNGVFSQVNIYDKKCERL